MGAKGHHYKNVVRAFNTPRPQSNLVKYLLGAHMAGGRVFLDEVVAECVLTTAVAEQLEGGKQKDEATRRQSEELKEPEIGRKENSPLKLKAKGKNKRKKNPVKKRSGDLKND